MAQADARRAQAEVDLLAVALARTCPRRGGRRGRARARVTYMQKPTPVITSGSSPSEWSRRNAAHSSIRGFAPSSANASMIAAGSVQIDPWLVSGVTVATSGSAAAAARLVEPALGHRGVGVEDHDVAARAAQAAVDRADEAEVLGVVQHRDRERRVARAELVDVLADRQLGRRVVDHEQLDRDRCRPRAARRSRGNAACTRARRRPAR